MGPRSNKKRTNYEEEVEFSELKKCYVDKNLINYCNPCSIHATSFQSKRKTCCYLRTYDQVMSKNVVCYYDCHKFKGESFGIPVKWDSDKDEFKLWGRFCSFECVSAYMAENIRKGRDREMSMFGLLTRKIYGRHIEINRAPSKYALQMFGGPLTIEDFRKEFNSSRMWVANQVKCGYSTMVYDVYLNNKVVNLSHEVRKKPDEDTSITTKRGTKRKISKCTEEDTQFCIKRENQPAHKTKRSLMFMLGKTQEK